ncbi:MAG TPA: N-6 DNA methylase [Bryobacteraceae bacterium]
MVISGSPKKASLPFFAEELALVGDAETYYRILLECVAARVTGAGAPRVPEFQRVVASLMERIELPEEPADFLNDVYRQLFPAAMRRRLGEYYTPDWLAEKLLIATMGRDFGDPAQRVFDPSCGSGVFLLQTIKQIRQRVAAGKIAPRRALELILRNVAGCDVNPLAVQTARTNYLLALGDLAEGLIDVPVYEADSVLRGPELAPFDYIVGNPPWINWQNLPADYRRETMALWEHYGLFPKRRAGIETILGAAKYDLSMLMTYVAADRYLRPGGRLGFVVPQAFFRAAAAGQGFRQFRLPDGTPLGVREVEDLVELKPFRDAANRTALLILEKGRETRYPVNYRYHRGGKEYEWRARPVSPDPTSPWVAAPAAALAAIGRLLSQSAYRAREGVNTGGANAVFWIEAVRRSEGLVSIRNIIEGARKQVPATEGEVESDLVYPLLRGRNVGRWSAVPEHSILVTHRPGMKLRALPETEMQAVFPGALSYLERFERLLRERPAYKRYFKPNAPFYSLFNIGEYTFAPWKVVWREQALPFTAAVAEPAGGIVPIPDHKLMIVPVDSEMEAHYLCGALNAPPVSAAVAAYAVQTQIATHVLEHIGVPRFRREEPVHRGLASASRRAHTAVRKNNPAGLDQAERAVNEWSARLWGLEEKHVRDMRTFLRDMGIAIR